MGVCDLLVSGQQPHLGDLQPLALEAGEDLAGEPAFEGVGLDQKKGALRSCNVYSSRFELLEPRELDERLPLELRVLRGDRELEELAEDLRVGSPSPLAFSREEDDRVVRRGGGFELLEAASLGRRLRGRSSAGAARRTGVSQ
jgi:hypothetical protein